MNLSTSDLATRELSIEELEAIAAGNWLGDAIGWVERQLSKDVLDKHVIRPVLSFETSILRHLHIAR
jgi:hypothetical protein